MSVGRYRVGVIGDPVAHSISPAMQQPALDALGVTATYERWHTAAADLPERIASLRAPDVLGANVTVPHKLAVMPLLDEVSNLARRAGAVNTIIQRRGRLSGDNTDVYGFATALQEALPGASERPTLVLGAGGAARAVLLALEQSGCLRIVVHNRNQERAESLVGELAPRATVAAGDDELAAELAATGVLINATSLGWHAGEAPIAAELLDLLPRDALVFDLTYRDTDLLLAARARGLQTLDGLTMLVHQGARALELWTGERAPVELMLAAAREARAPR